MILDTFKLDGRVALVTGAGRGIGRALAQGLAEAGADIACVTRTGNSPETRALVEASGRRFVDVKADLGSSEQREGIVDGIVAELGGIDILVNNAGVTGRHMPEDYPEADWRNVMEIHLHAAFDLAVQSSKYMLPKGGGKIINLGSVMSFEGGLHISAYASAKHAVAGLTKSLATSWAAKGINVNAICPGYTATELAGPLQNDPVRGPQILDRIPAGRWADPSELAGLCVFLASDASSYMHGTCVPIDGGWLAR